MRLKVFFNLHIQSFDNMSLKHWLDEIGQELPTSA